jgi:hypothetical protein
VFHWPLPQPDVPAGTVAPKRGRRPRRRGAFEALDAIVADQPRASITKLLVRRPFRSIQCPAAGKSAAGPEVAMITAVVRFPLPQGTTRDEAKALFEKSAPNYRGVPGLIRKYYLYGDNRIGGGVYLWSDRDTAERFYSDAWKRTIAQRYGAQPEILFFETPVIVENVDENAGAAVA